MAFGDDKYILTVSLRVPPPWMLVATSPVKWPSAAQPSFSQRPTQTSCLEGHSANGSERRICCLQAPRKPIGLCVFFLAEAVQGAKLTL